MYIYIYMPISTWFFLSLPTKTYFTGHAIYILQLDQWSLTMGTVRLGDRGL